MYDILHTHHANGSPKVSGDDPDRYAVRASISSLQDLLLEHIAVIRLARAIVSVGIAENHPSPRAQLGSCPPAEEIKTAPSLLRFAAIQDIESKQSLTYLAPQSRFVTAQPVEGEVGQVGQTQEATRKLGSRVGGCCADFDRRTRQGLRSVGDRLTRSSPFETLSRSEQRMDVG